MAVAVRPLHHVLHLMWNVGLAERLLLLSIMDEGDDVGEFLAGERDRLAQPHVDAPVAAHQRAHHLHEPADALLLLRAAARPES